MKAVSSGRHNVYYASLFDSNKPVLRVYDGESDMSYKSIVITATMSCKEIKKLVLRKQSKPPEDEPLYSLYLQFDPASGIPDVLVRDEESPMDPLQLAWNSMKDDAEPPIVVMLLSSSVRRLSSGDNLGTERDTSMVFRNSAEHAAALRDAASAPRYSMAEKNRVLVNGADEEAFLQEVQRHGKRFGLLEKKSRERDTWRERWFVLWEERLWYCKPQDTQRNLCYIPLSPGLRCEMEDERTFVLHDVSRSHTLRADTADEALGWVEAVIGRQSRIGANDLFGLADTNVEQEEWRTAAHDEGLVLRSDSFASALLLPSLRAALQELAREQGLEHDLLFWLAAERFRRQLLGLRKQQQAEVTKHSAASRREQRNLEDASAGMAAVAAAAAVARTEDLATINNPLAQGEAGAAWREAGRHAKQVYDRFLAPPEKGGGSGGGSVMCSDAMRERLVAEMRQPSTLLFVPLQAQALTRLRTHVFPLLLTHPAMDMLRQRLPWRQHALRAGNPALFNLGKPPTSGLSVHGGHGSGLKSVAAASSSLRLPLPRVHSINDAAISAAANACAAQQGHGRGERRDVSVARLLHLQSGPDLSTVRRRLSSAGSEPSELEPGGGRTASGISLLSSLPLKAQRILTSLDASTADLRKLQLLGNVSSLASSASWRLTGLKEEDSEDIYGDDAMISVVGEDDDPPTRRSSVLSSCPSSTSSGGTHIHCTRSSRSSTAPSDSSYAADAARAAVAAKAAAGSAAEERFLLRLEKQQQPQPVEDWDHEAWWDEAVIPSFAAHRAESEDAIAEVEMGSGRRRFEPRSHQGGLELFGLLRERRRRTRPQAGDAAAGNADADSNGVVDEAGQALSNSASSVGRGRGNQGDVEGVQVVWKGWVARKVMTFATRPVSAALAAWARRPIKRPQAAEGAWHNLFCEVVLVSAPMGRRGGSDRRSRSGERKKGRDSGNGLWGSLRGSGGGAGAEKRGEKEKKKGLLSWPARGTSDLDSDDEGGDGDSDLEVEVEMSGEVRFYVAVSAQGQHVMDRIKLRDVVKMGRAVAPLDALELRLANGVGWVIQPKDRRTTWQTVTETLASSAAPKEDAAAAAAAAHLSAPLPAPAPPPPLSSHLSTGSASTEGAGAGAGRLSRSRLLSGGSTVGGDGETAIVALLNALQSCSPATRVARPVREGYLYKRGRMSFAFRRRWFVLTQRQQLRYYDDQQLYKGTILLSKILRIEKRRDSAKFDVVTRYRTFSIMAADAADASAWVESLLQERGGNVTVVEADDRDTEFSL